MIYSPSRENSFIPRHRVSLVGAVGTAITGGLAISSDPGIQRAITETAFVPTSLGFLLKTTVDMGIPPQVLVAGLEGFAGLIALRTWRNAARRRL